MMRVLAVIVLAPALASQTATEVSTPTRPSVDPVIIEGRVLPSLIGKKPSTIVAFAYRDDAWRQIPVQIDERVKLPFAKILRRKQRTDPESLFYTDPNTFTGADPDANFDADDELVFLAADAGAIAPDDDPKGVRAKTRVELRLNNAAKDHSLVYLFASQGQLKPDAGAKHVRNDFKLVAGAYKEEYELGNRMNPEQTKITAPAYRLGFSDRWILDEMRLTVSNAPGLDILDGHKVQVIPGNCFRTTKTFSNGRGAIIANIAGPIRAIRSVIGANSGPLTERLWKCYPQRIDVITHLRVHALPSILMFFDYSADALGMVYHDNNNKLGATIDGKFDPIIPGKMLWQFVTGKPGSLLIHYHLETTLRRLVEFSLYDDNRKPKWNQCTGDNMALGAGGPLAQNLSNTDPRLGKSSKLTSFVILYPGAPGKKLGQVSVRAPRPIEVEVK